MPDSVFSFKATGPQEFTISDRAQVTVTDEAITVHLGPDQRAILADDGTVVILPEIPVIEIPADQPAKTKLYAVPAVTKVDKD